MSKKDEIKANIIDIILSETGYFTLYSIRLKYAIETSFLANILRDMIKNYQIERFKIKDFNRHTIKPVRKDCFINKCQYVYKVM